VGGAAAVAEQDDPPHALLPFQVLDAGLDVEGNVLPDQQSFVVVEAGIHREHDEPAAGELARRPVTEEVVDPMNDEHPDFRPVAPIGPVHDALDR
jgi:hypothetical protein